MPVDPAASSKMQGNVTVGVRPEAWRIVSTGGGRPARQGDRRRGARRGRLRLRHQRCGGHPARHHRPDQRPRSPCRRARPSTSPPTPTRCTCSTPTPGNASASDPPAPTTPPPRLPGSVAGFGLSGETVRHAPADLARCPVPERRVAHHGGTRRQPHRARPDGTSRAGGGWTPYARSSSRGCTSRRRCASGWSRCRWAWVAPTGSTTRTSTSSSTCASWPCPRPAPASSSESRWRGSTRARWTGPGRCGRPT